MILTISSKIEGVKLENNKICVIFNNYCKRFYDPNTKQWDKPVSNKGKESIMNSLRINSFDDFERAALEIILTQQFSSVFTDCRILSSTYDGMIDCSKYINELEAIVERLKQYNSHKAEKYVNKIEQIKRDIKSNKLKFQIYEILVKASDTTDENEFNNAIEKGKNYIAILNTLNPEYSYECQKMLVELENTHTINDYVKRYVAFKKEQIKKYKN